MFAISPYIVDYLKIKKLVVYMYTCVKFVYAQYVS